MSKFGDKFKNIFTVDYEDDYDDDFYDDYEEDNAEEAEPVVKKKRERVVRDDDFESAPSPTPSRTRTTRSTSSARNSGRSSGQSSRIRLHQFQKTENRGSKVWKYVLLSRQLMRKQRILSIHY